MLTVAKSKASPAQIVAVVVVEISGGVQVAAQFNSASVTIVAIQSKHKGPGGLVPLAPFPSAATVTSTS